MVNGGIVTYLGEYEAYWDVNQAGTLGGTVGDPLDASFDKIVEIYLAAGVDGVITNDPRLFDDPGTFDPERHNAKYHVAFGHGIHHCAGAHLARAEGRVTGTRARPPAR